MKNRSGRPLPVRPGLLGLWSLPFVMICPEHRRPLVTLWTMQDKLDRQDGSDAGLLIEAAHGRWDLLAAQRSADRRGACLCRDA
ncbi:hypothetical protein [Paracoccus aminovorans]|uniref:hypothetical protein n=1 Tax=Paracoccus aminovorans TaxID=34004 RepID=UPI000AC86D8E|nr:hypothetical protein [Paracoccus aminovorans]